MLITYILKNKKSVLCSLLAAIFFSSVVFPYLIELSFIKSFLVITNIGYFIGISSLLILLLVLSWNQKEDYLGRIKNTLLLDKPPHLNLFSFSLFFVASCFTIITFESNLIPAYSKQFEFFVIVNLILLVIWLVPFSLWRSIIPKIFPSWLTDNKPSQGDLKQSAQVLQSDEPIVFPEQDLLGRDKFVGELYGEITQLPLVDSFVYGLYGEWGEGKSSVLNLLRHRFKENDDFIVVNFNPWQFKDEEAIIRGFYFEIENAISGRYVYPSIGRVLAKYSKAISFGFGKAGLDFDFSFQEVTLLDIKQRIESYLKNLEKRILILIDDIDRVKPEEVLLVLKLVRHNFNLKNTVFLLALDHNIVMKYLSETLKLDPDFLDKVVQKPVHLPAFEQKNTDSFLDKHLDILFDELNLGKEFRDNFGKEILRTYFSTINRLFTNLRDVKRFLNSITTTLPAVKNEVNLYDLFIVELIKVFWPRVYSDIWKNRWYYITPKWSAIEASFLSPLEFIPEQEGRRYSTIKDHVTKIIAGEKEGDLLKELLMEIFPEVNRAFSGGQSGGDGKTFRAERRIAHPDCFRKYFMLKVLQSEISDEFIEETLNSWNAADKTKKVTIIQDRIKTMQQEEKLLEFLQKLELFKDGIQGDTVSALVKAVSLKADEFSTRATGTFFSQGEYDVALFLLMSLMNEKVDAKELQKVVEEIVEITPDLSFAATLVLYCKKERNATYFNVYDSIDHPKLRAKLAVRLKKFFVDGNKDIFEAYPQMWNRILHTWSTDWETFKNGNSKIVKAYIVPIIRTSPKKYAMFINGQKRRHPVGDSIYFEFDNLAKIYELSVLLEIGRKFQDEESLTQQEKETIRVFVEQLTAKLEGDKPKETGS